MAYINIQNYEQYTDEEKGWSESFHKAILDLERAGGGTLFFPAGIYRTCSIVLKSNMVLYLEAGAVLSYLDDPEKYEMISIAYVGKPLLMYVPLVYAENAENIAVTGFGTLDGNGYSWWKLKSEMRSKGYRRPHMICFNHCRNVKIETITLINSPAWTIHPLCCENVLIQGVSIKNPADSPNTDGIDPNSSRNVRILNCIIDVGDDCIAVKAGTEESDQPMPCENIVISNCIMVHGHGGVVIGSEMSGTIRNVVAVSYTHL